MRLGDLRSLIEGLHYLEEDTPVMIRGDSKDMPVVDVLVSYVNSRIILVPPIEQPKPGCRDGGGAPFYDPERNNRPGIEQLRS